MCGIAGWYRRGGRPVSASAVTGQCDAIFHRGPDDSGVLTEGDFGFGMRRLSILDVAGGHQPMSTPDGRYAIVFNGEIYNHRDLRPSLAELGYRFETHSDTETILAAFLHWGNDAWVRLEGMFAVAIWDRLYRELTLSRDHLGIKPLYLTQQRGGVAFASELKGLLTLPEHDFDVCERAVHDFFSFGHVRKPRSIYRQVQSLDPGHYLIVDKDGGVVARPFWEARFRPGERVSPADHVEQMRAMLLGSVARHMQSDVPVAAFLSGGVDSSAITAAMVRSGGQGVKAFTIGYPGTAIDETAAAREVADHLGCEHIVRNLDPADAIDVLPLVQRCYDEPFADMAAVPNWYLSKLAAEHVKVVLCGEGGDEMFAGYKRHRNARDIERFRPVINAARPLSGLLNRLPTTAAPRLNYLRQHGQRIGEFLTLRDGYQQFFAATQITSRSLRKQLYSSEFWRRHEGDASFDALEHEYFGNVRPGTGNALEQFLFADLTLNLPSQMLPRLDRASMAHSLEARVPFLSHTMVDWALTLPIDLKLNGRTGKYILREAVAPWLPPSVMKRSKQGFQMPLASWFRGDLGNFARRTWNDSGAANAGYLDPRAVEALFDEHNDGRADHGRMLYAIAMFSFWWIDSRAAMSRPRRA